MEIEFKMTSSPSEWRAFCAEVRSLQQQSFDEDGGMHNVGVQMMLAFDAGELSDDEVFMPID